MQQEGNGWQIDGLALNRLTIQIKMEEVKAVQNIDAEPVKPPSKAEDT